MNKCCLKSRSRILHIHVYESHNFFYKGRVLDWPLITVIFTDISINVCDVNVGAKFYSYFFCDGENEELQWEVHIAVTDGYMNTDFI